MANSAPKLKILYCVSGSIAAYKAADVVSALVKDGHEVQCLMTAGAREFVTPLVLETLSRRPVQDQLWGEGISGTEHIRLARWPDLIVFAPATANLIAKLALGLADDLVTTVALASEAPWLVAPAMNTVMWQKDIVQEHCATLAKRGAELIAPQGAGILACGEEGPGKLATVDELLRRILSYRDRAATGVGPQAVAAHAPAQVLRDQTILVTAGPTRSSIDAVRYITNPSTGRMGAAVTEEALRRGARVIHVLGVDKGVVRPIAPAGTEANLTVIEVETAEEMLKAALSALPEANAIAATAAVLDYRVEGSVPNKEKRGTDNRTLKLVPSADVLASLRNAARSDQWFLGFAAETDDIDAYAREKLAKKRLDYLFANPVARQGERLETGFGTSTNAGTLYRATRSPLTLELGTKSEIASRIWDELARDRGLGSVEQ